MDCHCEQINESSGCLIVENLGSFKTCSILQECYTCTVITKPVPTLLPTQVACFFCGSMSMYSITVTNSYTFKTKTLRFRGRHASLITSSVRCKLGTASTLAIFITYLNTTHANFSSLTYA
jgi:hypothetical protein